jgi:hypothetical protein
VAVQLMGLLVQILAGAEQELQGRVLAAAHLSEHLVMVVEAVAGRRMLEQPQQALPVAMVARLLAPIRLGPLQHQLVLVVLTQAVEAVEARTVNLVALVAVGVEVEAPLVLLELMEQFTPEAGVVLEANRHPVRSITEALVDQAL